jgi:hypothetical protein
MLPLCLEAKGFQLKGFAQAEDAQTLKIIAPVYRFIEEPDGFRVALFKHDAFYVLPRAKNSADTKRFLNGAKKSRKSYTWLVDAFNRQVYEVRDVQRGDAE